MTINEAKELHIFTDGGSRGNPGQAAIGIVIKDTGGNTIYEINRTLGIATNNIAEYTAVREALLYLTNELGHKTCEVRLSFFLDSELVVRQLTGIYKIKDAHLSEHAKQIKTLESKFMAITYSHVRREMNKEADALVNKALDAQASNKTP